MDIPDEGFYDVFSTDYQEMHDLMVTEIQRLAMGQQNPEEALARAAQEIRDRTGRQ
jgi:maltose-binding protein MalE